MKLFLIGKHINVYLPYFSRSLTNSIIKATIRHNPTIDPITPPIIADVKFSETFAAVTLLIAKTSKRSY